VSSASRGPGLQRSAALTPCTRSPLCRRSARCGLAIRRPRYYRCASWVIGFVPYSPLGHGFLTGTFRSPEDLADDDWRKNNPRFTEDNFEQNLRIVDEVEAVASEVDATPAQVALAWLLAQGDDIAPMPGTKRASRVEENMAADALELSEEQIARLNDLTPAAGERHNEASMSTIDR
jgi:aryl-alcohol dehydrogenase-like predicted oxidoreductase